MTDRVIKKGEQNCCYKLHQQKKGTFDILNYISEYVTFSQFLENFDNASHAATIAGIWIYDVIYKKNTSFSEILF